MKIIKWIPPVFKLDHIKGANGSHNLLFIKMDKNAPYFDAVLEQELVEWWMVTRWSLVVCAICASSFWWASDPVVPYLLTFAGYVGPRFAFSMVAPLNRYMEFRGHAAEIRYAVDKLGADQEKMIRQEVNSLTGYKSFRRWTKDEIRKELVKWI